MKSPGYSTKDRTYSSLVRRGGCITLPREITSFRLGQRVYFYARDGQLGFQARPKRTVRGKLFSSRIRRAIRSLAAYGPRARAYPAERPPLTQSSRGKAPRPEPHEHGREGSQEITG